MLQKACTSFLIASVTIAALANDGINKTATPTTPLVSGIEKPNMDEKIRIQDDFYRHVNGKWLDTTEIPADRPMWGPFYKLVDDAQQQLREIIENATKNTNPPGSEAQKISYLYASFMDEAAIESLGLKPLQDEFAKIDAIKDKKEIPALIAHLNAINVTTPYASYVHQDNRDATKYVVDLSQSGLGLPDRDYYLKDDDDKLKGIRRQYQAHIEKMLSMSGNKNAAGDAQDILTLETALAKVQWTKVENRDPIKAYNKVELSKLAALAPGFDWGSWLKAASVEGKVNYLIVSQPSYITGFNQQVQNTPLPVWKAYFKWHLLSNYAPYLSKAYVDERFAFYGTALRDIPENRPRWKRGVQVVESAIGEGLGKLYTAQHFPAENKARMQILVNNLMLAYKQSIDTLDWMGAATKQQAQAKLATFRPKIGYPDKWRDYSALNFAAGDLVGNVMRAQRFEYERNINKLGKPIDRDEWFMTPQSVNAYYNPELNEIVFPAAILRPPFFNAQADDAVNYGGIGAIIGHEISHGFDDQGSQYDGDGNLRDWWTKEDHEKFAAKTKALIEQYSAYEPVPGYHLNGELTLGENIADNSGLAIAYKAYQLSLAGKTAPVMDGYTGDQRFYMSFAQVFSSKLRDNYAIELIKSDPHSIPVNRVQGTVINQPAFYSAFGIKPDDKMYLAPEKRVIIW